MARISSKRVVVFISSSITIFLLFSIIGYFFDRRPLACYHENSPTKYSLPTKSITSSTSTKTPSKSIVKGGKRVRGFMNVKHLARSTGNTGCQSGHLSGYAPTCGDDGCLRTIVHDATWLEMKNKFKDKAVIRSIMAIKGWCAVDIHAPLARDLSVMQWRHDIIGSVGEIGVYMGKYSSILALVTNTRAGERYFAADIFETRAKMNVSASQWRLGIFLRAMEKVGFSTDSPQAATRLHLFVDNSFFLSKSLFVYWGLPSVRILSIDGGHLRPIVLNDFQIAACVMRKGGIVIFDDAFNKRWTGVKQAIRDFFNIYGSDVFRPIIFTSSKLFVCTSDYYDTYMNYIRKHLTVKYKLQEKKENVFLGKGYSYFTR